MGRASSDRGDGGSFSASSYVDDASSVFASAVRDLRARRKRLSMYSSHDLDADVGGELMTLESFAPGDDSKSSGPAGEISAFSNKDTKSCFLCTGVTACMASRRAPFTFAAMGDIGAKWNESSNQRWLEIMRSALLDMINGESMKDIVCAHRGTAVAADVGVPSA